MKPFIRQISWWFSNEILAIPWRFISFVFIILLFLFPLFIQDPYILRVLIITNIFVLFAASWDFLSGYTGQFNLGHALFLGVAAYTAALLNTHLGLQPWATIPMGALVALVIGLIVAMPALRLRGFYLALVTLSFPIILIGIVNAFPNLLGGEVGIYGVEPLTSSRVLAYYVVLLIMLISVFIMWKLTDVKSKIVRIGVILHAIREDEITARASGIDTTRYKILAFAISGFLGGIAGGLYVHFVQVAGPSTLAISLSFNALLFTIFGGIMTIYGAVVGTYILYPLIDFLRLNPFMDQIRIIIMAIMLIFVMLFMPGGLTRWIRDRIEVDCPRCKIINISSRRLCRVCSAPLHLDIKRKSGV
jgi:branched-chain amino acid transport system permease protein